MIEIDLGLFTKVERGTHVERVKVTRGGKTFYREQRVGKKPSRKDTGKIASLPENMKKEILDLRRLGDSGARIKEVIENMIDVDPDLRDKLEEKGIVKISAGAASLTVTGQSLVDWAKARGVESTKKRKTVKAVEEKAEEIEEKRFKEANEKLARLQTENKMLQEQLDREVKSKMESDAIRDKLRNENYILREKLKGLEKPGKEGDNKKLVSQYLSGMEHASRHLKMEKSAGNERLQIEIDLGIFNKAQDEGVSSGRPGLVRKKVTVKRGGKTFQQYRWVKAGAEEPSEKKPSIEEPVAKPKKELVIIGLNKPEEETEPEKKLDFAVGLKKGMTINFKGEDKKIKFFNPDAKTVTFVGDSTNYSFEEVNEYGKESEGEIKVGKPEPKVEEEPKAKSVGDLTNEIDSFVSKFKSEENGKEMLDDIRMYTQMTYFGINSYLRRGETGKEGMDKKIKNISKLLQSAPKMGGTVYRGMKFDSNDDFDKFLSQIESNKSFKSKSFTSTSMNEESAIGHATSKYNNIVFEIKSKSGVFLNGMSKIPGENEILLDKGAKFNIINIDKSDIKNVRVIMEEV